MIVVVLSGLLACGDGSGEDSASGAGSGADSGVPTFDMDTGACGDVPIATWSTFGQGFVDFYCQGCHASTAQNRFGAPESVTFDTEEDAIRNANRILARSTGDTPTMPPSGGVPADDLYLLEVWLNCWI